LAGILMAWLAPPAMAQFGLRLEDTGANVGAVLYGTEIPTNDVSGQILYSGSIGAFQVVITSLVTRHSDPANNGDLDMVNFTATTATGGTLKLTGEDTGYTNGAGGTQTVVGTVGGTISGSGNLTIQSWADGGLTVPGGAVPSLGTAAGTGSTAVSLAGNPLGAIPASSTPAWIPAFNTSSGSFSSTSSNSFTSSPTGYSLFLQATLVMGAGSQISFDEEQQVVSPAPAGLMLAISALPVLGLVWLRRRLKIQPGVAAA